MPQAPRPGPPACHDRPSFRAWLAGLVTLLLLPSALLSQPATDDPACDTGLVRPQGDPLAYGPRGARCEGLYVQEVSGVGGLTLAALTEPLEPSDLSAGDVLLVEWSAPADVEVRLRATSLRRRMYYRMDAVSAPGARRFEWPADVLARLGLSTAEVGVRGWIDQMVGDRVSQVHVPLRLGKADRPERVDRYVALVVPGSDLQEAFVTVAAVGPGGRDETFVQRDEPLGYGFYPSGRPIRIPLPPLEQRGLHRLQVGALLAGGGSSTMSLYFHHEGR